LAYVGSLRGAVSWPQCRRRLPLRLIGREVSARHGTRRTQQPEPRRLVRAPPQRRPRALAKTTNQAVLSTLITIGRQRHSARRQKNRPSFPHTKVTTPTVTGPAQITRFQHDPTYPLGAVTCTNNQNGAGTTTSARGTAPIRSDMRTSDNPRAGQRTPQKDQISPAGRSCPRRTETPKVPGVGPAAAGCG
jgi:hypothetical protein